MSDIKPWKKLSSETALDAEKYKVRKDICQLPDGTIIQDCYVHLGGEAVLVFCVNKEKKVILVRQYRHAVGEVLTELPSGFQNRHDLNIAETARRVLLEETGYSSEELIEVGVLWGDPSLSTTRIHIFYAPQAEKVAAPKRGHEHIETTLFSLEETEKMILQGEMSSLGQVASFCLVKKHLENIKK